MKLGTKLVLFFLLLSVIPLAIVGYLAYDSGTKAIERDIFHHLISINILKQAEFENWVQYNERLLSQLSRRPTLVEQAAVLVSLEQSNPKFQATCKSIRDNHLAQIAKEKGTFVNLFILRASDGMVLVASDEKLEGKYKSSQPYFVEGKSRTYVQNVYYSMTLQQPAIAIATPIKDKEGDLIAVLAGHLDLAELSDIMTLGRGLSQTEDTYLVNRFNYFITEPRFGQDYALKKATYTEGVEAALAGNEGIGFYKNYRGVSVIGAYNWLPDWDMCIITEINQDEAYAPIIALRNIILALAGAIAFVVVLLGLFFARTITRPVRQLVNGAEAISQGDLDYKVEVKGKDEIAWLAGGFNEMAAKLKLTQEEKAKAEAIATAARIATETIEGMMDPVILTDLGGKITQFNRAAGELFGYGDEVIGEVLTAFVAEDDAPRLVQALSEVMQKGSVQNFQCTALTKGRGKLLVLGNGTLRKDKEGNRLGIIVAIRDITELRQMQEKLISSERLATLGQFSGSISHELRNPLGTIDSSVYYLQMKLKDADEKVHEHLERIRSSVASSTAIIESILNLTRMKAPELTRVDLATITSDAVATTKIPDTVSVVRDFPEQEVLVNADREQLRIAFKNIIKNAVEAMDGKGTLTVAVHRDTNGYAQVSFADTGPGIAPENLDRIFQPLFSTKAKGIGFGLSITKMIVDKHGGSIEAKSESGKGAVLIVRLPKYFDEANEV